MQTTNHPFAVSKDEWHTKEGTSKAMKNALYVQWYGKGTSWTEVTSYNKEIKPVALSIVKLQ